MAAQLSVTEGSPNLEEWLKQFEIKDQFAKQYVECLKEIGVESVNDFKYIENKNDLDELLKALKGLRFMDKKKIEKAWKSLHSQGAAQAKPIHTSIAVPMDANERAALETLGKYAQSVQQKMSKYEAYIDSKFLTKETNMIREQIESLKNAIDVRGHKLIKDLQIQYNDIKNECSLEYKKWKDIGIKIHSTKQICDEALKISDFQKLETRRNTIINAVDNTVKAVESALKDVSVVEHKKIIVDLDEFKMMEENMKNIGRVYTRCFQMNVTNVSCMQSNVIVNWKLKSEKEMEMFKNVCSKLNVKIGIVIDDNDEKKMEEPGNDRNKNVKWMDDVVYDDVKSNKIEIKNAKILMGVKDKYVVVVKVVALDNKGNIIQQTENKYFQCKEDGVKFIGYVQWKQIDAMGKDEEDNAMNDACSSKYNGSRAATYKELFDGKIKGLVKPTDANYDWVLLHSGNDDLWKGSARQNGNRRFYRGGLDKNKYPWNENSKSDCSDGTRGTIAVNRNLLWCSLKK